jgi:hypothetical protein
VTSSTGLNAHDRDNLRDACMSGLVPCDGDCGANETRRDFNAADWTLALRGATEWRRERVATLIRRKAPSLSFLAQDYGIVPHAKDCIGCAGWIKVNRNAAAIIGFERRHPHTSIWHTTAWQMAR